MDDVSADVRARATAIDRAAIGLAVPAVHDRSRVLQVRPPGFILAAEVRAPIHVV